MNNISYEQIVNNFNKPTLVLAGPGAGKTYLLCDRVKRLLDSDIDEKLITVLTFGKDANQNTRNKLLDTEKGFGIQYAKLPRISTLHSLGFEIVNKKPKNIGLCKIGLKVQNDEFIKKLLFRDASFILGYTEEDGEKARKCKEYGNCNIDCRKIECSICQKYWNIMSKCNRIDFDDQILLACRILENIPEILKEYQNNATHLLVDEYQDINAAQFKLIDLLSKENRNGLFVVGDDAQSIYGFRGADPKFILNFNEDFPGSLTPPLTHSRRCTENIMNTAIKVLKKYYDDWTGPYELEYHIPKGEEPKIWQLPSEMYESEMVAKIARRGVSEKKSVLILAPKKDFFPLLSKSLTKYGVPHHCPINLLSKNINKHLDVISTILNWIKNPNDNFLTRLVIETIINHGVAKVPGAKKGKQCKPETIQYRIEIEKEIAEVWELIDKNHDFFSIICGLESSSDIIKQISESLKNILDSYNNHKDLEKGEFSKLLAITSGIWTDPFRVTEDLLSIRNLLESPQPTGFGAVQMMTMRKAKGLEADIVILIGLEDDIIPNPIAEIKEEARLFYVSMTRAIEKLYLLHSYKRPRNISYGPEITSKKRSRFLDSLEIKSKYFRSFVGTA